MTQVQTMTNPELNRALAELMGYGVYTTPGDHFCLISSEKMYLSGICDDEITAWKQAPDYCTDPAASLEVEKAAIEAWADKYVSNLDAIVNQTVFDKPWQNNEIAKLLSATPRERAEAAYITLSQANTEV